MEQETSNLEKQLEVEAACQRYHVERLERFGSALVSEADAQDYDFLVQLGEKS